MASYWILLVLIFLTGPSLAVAMSAKGCNGEPIRNKCQQEYVNKDVYGHMDKLSTDTYGDATNCYFVVKGASFLVNSGNETRIDLNKGRKICDGHDAFLPIVLTETENDFLRKTYSDITEFILLGLHRATYEDYIWDDQHGPVLKPKKWLMIKEMTTGTYTVLMTASGEWVEYYPNKTWPNLKDIPVICHQRGYGPDGQSFSDAKGNWLPRADNCTTRRPLVRRHSPTSSGFKPVTASTLGLVAVVMVLVACILI